MVMSWLTNIHFILVFHMFIVSFEFSNDLIKTNNVIPVSNVTNGSIFDTSENVTDISSVVITENITDINNVKMAPKVNVNFTENITAINNVNMAPKDNVNFTENITAINNVNMAPKDNVNITENITAINNVNMAPKDNVNITENITDINNVKMGPKDNVNITEDVGIDIETRWIFEVPMKKTPSAISVSFDNNMRLEDILDTLFKTPLEFWTNDILRKYGNRALWTFCGRLCSRLYLDIKDPFKRYGIECLNCSCDFDCQMHGDCCLRDPLKVPKPLYDCKKNIEKSFVRQAVYMRKTQCSGNWTNDETRDLCELSSSCEHLPVTTKFQVTYQNEHCALCNMEANYIKWSLDFALEEWFSNYKSVQSFIEFILKCEAKLFIKPPSEVRKPKLCDERRSYDVINTCNVTGLWTNHDDILEKQCLEHHTPFYHRGDKKVYENMYCFLCNGRWVNYGFTREDNEEVTLTRMIHPKEYKVLDNLSGLSCNATWRFYNPHQNSCKTIECSEHLEYKEEECLPLTDESKILHFMLNVSSIKNIRHKVKNSLEKLGIHRYIAILGVIQQNIYLHVFCHSNFQFAAKLLSLVKSDWTFGSHVTTKNLLNKEWTKVWEMISDDVYMSCCKGRNNSKSHKSNSIEISDFSLCPHVKYDKTEFESAGNDTLSLRLKDTNLTFTKEEYQPQRHHKFVICIKTLKDKIDPIDNERLHYDPFLSKHLEILENIISTLSLACLVLTFLTYFNFPLLRTLPAKNNMALITCLFFAQLGLVAAKYVKQGTTMCKIIGIFVHYSWLSVFFWMNVCSFHMFTVFRSANVSSSSSTEHRKRLLKYFLFANGTPVVIVSTVIAISMATTYTIGYGAEQCYLDNVIYVGISTILPLVIVVCLNLIFLGKTIHSISKTANIARASGKDRQHMKVYIKLSTFTGLFWTFEILSNFFLPEVFLIISALLNYGQGIFIFLSYVANKRVANLWLDLCREKLRKSTDSNTKSTK